MTGPVDFVVAKIDCHVHSGRSSDGYGTVKELAAQARRRALNGFVLTDHNVFPDTRGLRENAGPDLILVPGMEVSTKQGHVLAIGVQEEIRPLQEIEETVDQIHASGAVAVPSHPYRLTHGIWRGGLDRVSSSIHAVEVFNASDGAGLRARLARNFAREHALGGVGGSDCHRVRELGNAYATFPSFPNNADDVVALIQKRVTWGEGRGTSLDLKFLQKVKTLSAWVGRGFRPL